MKHYLFLLLSCLPFMGKGQIITTIAGTGSGPFNGDNIQATSANISYTPGVEIDKSGNIYIADANNKRIRKVNISSGIITTVAGNGTTGSSGDGAQATSAQLNSPQYLAFDTSGNLYISDAPNHCIRKVDKVTGIITTIAGNGSAGFSGDGNLATLAKINGPLDITFDKWNNLYIADNANQRIRKVNAQGMISTIAGDGTTGDSGDGGNAISAQLNYPFTIDVDTNGDLFIADLANAKIRKVDVATNIITTFAGNGLGTYSGDGNNAINAGIAPWGLAFDKANNLYVSDYANNRIRKIEAGSNLISTVAGIGVQSFGGDDSAATIAKINHPEGVAVDTCGNLFISDYGNRRIRKVTFNTNCAPTNIPTQTTPITFTLYPNPATSQITITSNTRLKDIHILNTLGQVVTMVNAADKKAIINIGTLPAGIYYVRITDEHGQTRTEKIIKEQCDNCNPSLQNLMEEPE